MLTLLREKLAHALASHTHKTTHDAASALDRVLHPCRTAHDFHDKLHSTFVRGYIVGFFEGFAQFAGVHLNDAQELATFLERSHAALLRHDVTDPSSFVAHSLTLAHDPEFTAAKQHGGSEYFEFWSDRIKSPLGLHRYFHGSIV